MSNMAGFGFKYIEMMMIGFTLPFRPLISNINRQYGFLQSFVDLDVN